MNQVRRFMRRVLVPAVLLGSTLASVGMIASPSPAHACTYGPASLNNWAEDPGRSVSEIIMWGGLIGSPDIPCGVTHETQWTTKACGSFGCSWEVQASSGVNSPTSNYYSQFAIRRCRIGLHRYQTRSVARNVGGPGYTQVRYSGDPQILCALATSIDPPIDLPDLDLSDFLP